ncbi:MAG: chromosome partitioning protein ParB, chromosome partitioning protein ParB family [Candidatus Parcubacteria bacterium]|jgi:ParB family chromosome partitioning protein
MPTPLSPEDQSKVTKFYGDSVFWIEVGKINPNPYQPRRDFDEARLKDLSESIRMYGILQPLVVTRREVAKEDGGLVVEYELISGERRLRASKLAGLSQVPALIRSGEEDSRVKLELAIIENLQREDINAVDRARAFEKLANEFGMKHAQIAEKVGKSREYVSNTLRILALAPEILDALSQGKISDGHTRPLLMLVDRPEEQMTLFKEIVFKKMSVREAEAISRKIATDRIRKKERAFDPVMVELENKLNESLGTRVHIEQKDTGNGVVGGKIVIDFFSTDDLRAILDRVTSGGPAAGAHAMMDRHIAKQNGVVGVITSADTSAGANGGASAQQAGVISDATPLTVDASSKNSDNSILSPQSDEKPVDDRAPEEVKADEESDDLYSMKNFSL